MLAAPPVQDLLDGVEVGVEAQAGHGAERATLLAVLAVVDPEQGVLHGRAEILHLDDVVGAGDDASRTSGADLGGHDLRIEVFPVLAFGRAGRVSIGLWRTDLTHTREYMNVPGLAESPPGLR